MPSGNRICVPSSVARLVGQDHDRLVRLLRRACTPGPNQDRWRTEFADLLRAHRAAEHTELLGRLAEIPDVREVAAHQDDDDATLDDLADEVAQAAIGTDAFSDLCGRAEQTVRAHRDALREVLARLDAAVGRKEMRRFGGCYQKHRDDHLDEQRPRRPPPRRLDVSRAELYELAKRAGIEGRSAMSRDELIDELQRRHNY
jgi:hypothetical protein